MKTAGADATVPIERFLADEGFIGANAALGRATLEAAGLTRAGKTGISSTKLDRARAALEEKYARVCGRAECREVLAGDHRELLEVPRANCEVCGGSDNAGAVRRMVAACADAGVRRIVVVGGTPTLWGTLGELVAGDPIELRTIDGTRATNEREALQNCAWADLVIVWAPTPLAHRVSDLYGADRCVADHVEVHRRGIAALATEVTTHLKHGA